MIIFFFFREATRVEVVMTMDLHQRELKLIEKLAHRHITLTASLITPLSCLHHHSNSLWHCSLQEKYISRDENYLDSF